MIWSVTKTCPIFSQYNVYWYFYEDVGELVPKSLPPESTKESEEETQQTAVISEQSKGQILNELYVQIHRHLEQVYLLNQHLQNFDWSSIEHLTWISKDEEGNECIEYMLDVLPSQEALQPLLIQNDRCNAFIVMLWRENSYENSTNRGSKHIAPVAWYTRYTMIRQLEVEIDKAEDLANNIQLNTNKRFADIERELNIPGTMSNAYVSQVQRKGADYKGSLNETIQCLERARLLAVEIKHLAINPFSLNVP